MKIAHLFFPVVLAAFLGGCASEEPTPTTSAAQPSATDPEASANASRAIPLVSSRSRPALASRRNEQPSRLLAEDERQLVEGWLAYTFADQEYPDGRAACTAMLQTALDTPQRYASSDPPDEDGNVHCVGTTEDGEVSFDMVQNPVRYGVVCPDHSRIELDECVCEPGYVSSGEALGNGCVEDTWEPPDGLRKPAADRGTWDGTVGDSDWTPNEPEKYGLQPGQKVRFREGRVDFSEYAVQTPAGGAGTIDLPGMTGDAKGDRIKAVQAIAERDGVTEAAVEKWLTDERLRLHHFGCTMQVVRSKLHNLAHQGSAADLRSGDLGC